MRAEKMAPARFECSGNGADDSGIRRPFSTLRRRGAKRHDDAWSAAHGRRQARRCQPATHSPFEVSPFGCWPPPERAMRALRAGRLLALSLFYQRRCRSRLIAFRSSLATAARARRAAQQRAKSATLALPVFALPSCRACSAPAFESSITITSSPRAIHSLAASHRIILQQ